MEVHISKREKIACKIMSHLQFEKNKPAEESEFYDNRFNRALLWIVLRFLQVNPVDIVKKVDTCINHPETVVIYD